MLPIDTERVGEASTIAGKGSIAEAPESMRPVRATNCPVAELAPELIFPATMQLLHSSLSEFIACVVFDCSRLKAWLLPLFWRSSRRLIVIDTESCAQVKNAEVIPSCGVVSKIPSGMLSPGSLSWPLHVTMQLRLYLPFRAGFSWAGLSLALTRLVVTRSPESKGRWGFARY